MISSGVKNVQVRISGWRGEGMYESRCGVCCNSCERKEAVLYRLSDHGKTVLGRRMPGEKLLPGKRIEPLWGV